MKKLLGILLALIVLGGLAAFVGYRWIFSPNTAIIEPYELYIPHQTSFADIMDELESESVLANMSSFEQVAKLMKYDKDEVPSGRYIIQPDWSNKQIISTLRAGIQSPIKLTISTARTVEDVAGVVGERIEADSLEVLSLFRDTAYISSLGFEPETIISLVIPDTYEMYWNTTAEDFFSRMKKEYDKFWADKQRQSQLSDREMTRAEVSTLASIVEKETNLNSERPRMAGVYLNRLQRGIKLQADPTVVFGVGDFSIRRVLNKHLEYDSPYNTYMYEGLPPGPICMPSKSSIDAVLNAEQHDYLFFCAKPGYQGEHAFAKTNRQHERNAVAYRRWLNQERIMK